MKEIHLDLVRVTEAAARAASAWIGSGDKEAADAAATEAMRERLNQMDFAARVVIGEGMKDKSAGLFAGETVGKLRGDTARKFYEIAVDPIEGTRPVATSGPEAMSVIAVAGEKSLFSTGEFYLNKLAYGADIAQKIQLDITDPLDKTIRVVSAVTGKDVPKIVVCVLDRPRHDRLVAELRRIGVRVKLIMDCDVSASIAACLPESGIDLYYGIGGAPEAVVAACAIKCLRGGFQVQMVKKDWKPDGDRVFTLEDLVKGPCAFVATGITNGSLLKGVRYTGQGTVTHSVFMRHESGTVRWLTAFHGS